MKGTVFDLMKLAAEKPKVARELAELAARHGIELSDEVSDDELEMVAGGLASTDLEDPVATQGDLSQLSMMDLQNQQEVMSRTNQTMSSMLKSWHDTSKSIINNLRG